MGGRTGQAGNVFRGRFTRLYTRRSLLGAMGVLLVVLVLLSTHFGGVAVGRMHPPRARNMSPTSNGANHDLKATLRQYIKALGHTPLVYPVVNVPAIKRVLSALPVTRALYGSKWDRKHPFDRAYGTDTSGFLYGGDLLTGHPAEQHGSPYAGAQPSILRTALAALPRLERATFIDLGCGKGRPMLVASEFPFRDIVGVELSPPLAAVARANAAVVACRYPERTPVRVEQGDATVYPMPDGDVVLFIYNSFDRELMLRVVAQVERAIKRHDHRSVYVIYCNPVYGDCFDASPHFTRRFARTLPYTTEEQGFAENTEDAVIIWQGGGAPPPVERADGRIIIVTERWRAELHV